MAHAANLARRGPAAKLEDCLKKGAKIDSPQNGPAGKFPDDPGLLRHDGSLLRHRHRAAA